MDSYKKALEFATRAHAGQRRKYHDEDYITHPMAVAKILELSRCKEPLLSAALLHDTIEDTSTKLEEIETEFGPEIAKLVYELTSDKDEVRRIGKTEYLTKKLNNMSDDALTIKLADRLHNVSGLEDEPSNFREKYSKETISILENLNRSLTSLQMNFILRIKMFLKE